MAHVRSLAVLFLLIGPVPPALGQRGSASGTQQLGPQEFHIILRVRDGRVFAPLKMALVTLRGRTGVTVGTAYTDGNGVCEFERIPEGTYSIEVTLEDYRPGSVESIVLAREAMTTQRIDVNLDRANADGPSLPGSPSEVSPAELLIPKKAQQEFQKGLEEQEQNRPDKSIEHFEKAVREYPQFSEAYNQWALIHMMRGEIDSAGEVLEQSRTHNALNAKSLALMGIVNRERGDLEESKQSLLESVEADPNDPLAQLELARTLLQMKDPAASSHARKACELDPQQADAYLVLFNGLVEERAYSEALSTLDSFLERFPDHSSAAAVKDQRNQLADYLARRGQK